MNNFNNIPLELRILNQWVCWRQEIVNGRPTKVPYHPLGYKASSTEPRSWASFEQCCAAIGFDGIGFMFSQSDPYSGIDLDDVDSNHPKRDEILVLQKAVLEFLPSYTEISPSGKGFHVIVKGSVPTGKHPKGIGIFSSERYFTFTGNVKRDLPINEYDLLPLWEHLNGPARAVTEPVSAPQYAEDDAILETARNAANGDKFARLYDGDWSWLYESQSEADLSVLNMLAFYTQNMEQIERLFRRSNLYRAEKQHKLAGDIKKALDQSLPTISTAALIPPPIRAIAETIKENIPVPQEPLENPYLQPVPGLLGEIASFIYNASTRPVPEIALAGAIGLMAGICGRSWNVSNTGLNVYLLLLSETGTGKESIASGIEQLFAQLRKPCPAIDNFAGPGRIASGPALITELADRKTSCLSIVGEFGIRLQRMTQNANTGDLALLGDLLDLYTKSGKGQVLRSMIYADKAKNTKSIFSPAFTLVGETEPTRFFNVISEDMIAAGLLPRFIMIEYKGIRVPRRIAPQVIMNPQVLDYLGQMASQSLSLSAQGHVTNITEGPGFAILDAFDRECDDHINSTSISVIKHLWNRGHLNALKLAALAETGMNYINPTIGEYCARWAVSIVRYSIEMLVKRFTEKGVGLSKTGEDKMFEDVREIIDTYCKSSSVSFKSEDKKIISLHANLIVPSSYILKRVNNRASFRNSNIQTTMALKQILNTMVDDDMLELVPRTELSTNYNTTMKSFRVKWIKQIE